MGKFPANLETPSVPLPAKDLGVVAKPAFHRAGPSGGFPVSRAMHPTHCYCGLAWGHSPSLTTPTPPPLPAAIASIPRAQRPSRLGPGQVQVTDPSLQRGCLECIAHSLDHSFGGYTGDTLATLGVAYVSPRPAKPALQRGQASEPCRVRRGCPGAFPLKGGVFVHIRVQLSIPVKSVFEVHSTMKAWKKNRGAGEQRCALLARIVRCGPRRPLPQQRTISCVLFRGNKQLRPRWRP